MKLYKIIGLVFGICLIPISAILIYFYLSRAKTPVSSPLKIPGKIIIDTDAGGDDASAILLALTAQQRMQSKGFEVIAITCVYGNTNLTNVALNVRKILTIANRGDIPVFIGAHRSLLKNYTKSTTYGEDGLGDFKFDEEIISEIDRSKHASVALIDLARKHAGNISVLTLGPLTNIAVAITLDPSFVYNVERFYIMGASVHAVGNIAMGVEFNFYQDPYSNFIVLNNTRGLPIILFPWETALTAAISKEWRTDVLGAIESKTMEFLNKVEAKSRPSSIWRVADLMITALIIWPELITRTRLTNVSPVYDGSAEGSVLLDYMNRTGRTQNTLILEGFDVEGFKQVLIDSFS